MHFFLYSLLLAIVALLFTFLSHKNLFATSSLPAHRGARVSCTFVSFPIPCGLKLSVRPGTIQLLRRSLLGRLRSIPTDIKRC